MRALTVACLVLLASTASAGGKGHKKVPATLPVSETVEEAPSGLDIWEARWCFPGTLIELGEDDDAAIGCSYYCEGPAGSTYLDRPYPCGE